MSTRGRLAEVAVATKKGTNGGASTIPRTTGTAATSARLRRPTFDSIYNLADWSAAPSPLTITNVNVESSCRRLTGSAVSVKILVKSGGTTTAGATSQNC